MGDLNRVTGNMFKRNFRLAMARMLLFAAPRPLPAVRDADS
jgi:hypothetical protein